MSIDLSSVVVEEIFQDFLITVNLDHDLDKITEDTYKYPQ